MLQSLTAEIVFVRKNISLTHVLKAFEALNCVRWEYIFWKKSVLLI